MMGIIAALQGSCEDYMKLHVKCLAVSRGPIIASPLPRWLIPLERLCSSASMEHNLTSRHVPSYRKGEVIPQVFAWGKAVLGQC